MREITCEERDRCWGPFIQQGEVVPGEVSTNFMGNGVVVTKWVWSKSGRACVRDEKRYDPHSGGFPDGDVESCRHWEYRPEGDDT